MTPIEEEITNLSKKWIEYINLDGHKDRDCHWYVEQRFSYGEKPYFQAYHHGYVGDDFQGTKCTTLEEAQEERRDRLLFAIHDAKKWLEREIKWYKDKAEDDSEFAWGDPEEYQKVLDILNDKTSGV